MSNKEKEQKIHEIAGMPVTILGDYNLPNDVSYSLTGNNTHGYYIYANVTATLDVKIGDSKLVLVYQNGHGFEYGDYSCITNDFCLYDEGVLGAICKSDGEFYDQEELYEVLGLLKKEYNLELSETDVFDLYQLITDNEPTLDKLGICTDLEKFTYGVAIDLDGNCEERAYEDVDVYRDNIFYVEPIEE